MKHIIIGNGIIALSIAFKLLKQSLENDEIVIIGPNHREGSATNAAGAMLNSYAEFNPLTLKTKAGSAYFDISRQATKDWPNFISDIFDWSKNNLSKKFPEKSQIFKSGYFGMGTYILNNTSSDEFDDANYESIIYALKKFKEPFEFVNPKEIPNYKPSQKNRAIQSVFIPGEGWLNPSLVIEQLDQILINHPQVKFVDDIVCKLDSKNNKITSIMLSNEKKIEGDTYLVANGANAGELISKSKLGLKIQKMFYGVGVSIQLDTQGNPHKNCIRTPNRGGGCGVYSIPHYLGEDETKDHIMVGATNYISNEPKKFPRISGIETLMRNAINEINNNFYAATLIKTNVGWRPTTQDTFPLLGKSSLDNLFVATGTKRDGFHNSPVISENIASLMRENKTINKEFQIFNPEREFLKELSREDAIETIVNGLMSEHYQHDYNPPNIRMNEMVKRTHREEVEKLHDKIGAFEWGIPQELVPMYRRGYAK